MRNFLEYIPFIAVATAVRALPRRLALAAGGRLGRLVRHLQTGRVHIASENLRHAFPEMAEDEIRATISAMFTCLGESFVDMLRLDRYRGRKDLDRYFEIDGQEHIDAALKLGRGCIILTGHVGFWEAGTFFLPQLGYTTGVVAKPIRNPLVDRYFQRMRTAAGSYIINSRKGARGILKALQKNHCVCLLLDQHIKGPGSVVAPFFGRPTHTTTIITQMAARYQVPIVPAFVYRQPDQSYRCSFQPMRLLADDLSETGIRDQTALLNKLTEDGIRQAVPQWFWLHRRWRRCCEQ
ncbi:MAG: lysophospholipid acyltransferase family protein [Desulfuromonadales bacterium]|nr:lysophospholipid acyltransferase family protein [Desulfuromonadales bacterium]